MRKGMSGFFMVVCCGALLAGGCTKKEMVKGEEPMAAKPAETAPAKPAGKEEVTGELPKETPPTTSTVKEEPLQEQAAKTMAESALMKVYFDYNSYVLSSAAREILNKDADYLMKKNASVKVQVEGHCDERGSDEYNLALGEKRAKAVIEYLVTLGVPASRLSYISYGKEKPSDPGHDEAAWAKNRRADFVVIK